MHRSSTRFYSRRCSGTPYQHAVVPHVRYQCDTSITLLMLPTNVGHSTPTHHSGAETSSGLCGDPEGSPQAEFQHKHMSSPYLFCAPETGPKHPKNTHTHTAHRTTPQVNMPCFFKSRPDRRTYRRPLRRSGLDLKKQDLLTCGAEFRTSGGAQQLRG